MKLRLTTSTNIKEKDRRRTSEARDHSKEGARRLFPLIDWMKDVDVRVQYGLNFGKSRGFIKIGDSVIVVTGWRQGSGFTNTLRVVYVEHEFIKEDPACTVYSDTDSYENLLK
ncbi:KPYK kinase, partial [Acromyrmex insinuator]